jgi:hypothetical protein
VSTQRFTSPVDGGAKPSMAGSRIPVPNQQFPQRIAQTIKAQSGLLLEVVKLSIRWNKLSRPEPESWVYKDPNEKGPKKPPKPPKGGGQTMKQRPARMLA